MISRLPFLDGAGLLVLLQFRTTPVLGDKVMRDPGKSTIRVGLPYPSAYDNFLIVVSFVFNGLIVWYVWTWV